MKKINIGVASTFLMALAAAACSPDTGAEKGSPLSAEEQQTIESVTNSSFKIVVPTMMNLVKEKVQSVGPAGAVVFCNESVAGMGKKMTEKLATEFKATYGISQFRFGRTSLKIRNPANKPDAVQEEILQAWQTQEQQGGKAEMATRKSGDVLYGMLPIRIASPACLKCHGSEEARDAGAAEVIQARYPEDAAVGYKQDELRGGFWVKAQMH